MAAFRRCPRCDFHREDGESLGDRCEGCGLSFHEYQRELVERARQRRRRGRELAGGRLGRWLLSDDRPPDPLRLRGYALLWLLFAIWGLRLLWLDFETNRIGASFMHTVNLMFHEAGHAVFRPFGRFMSYLGGSLMQLLVPAGVVLAFLTRHRDPFAASIGLWWLGVSLMDLAPYIGDARRLELVLLGGGTGADRPGMHDWNNILGALGLLEADRALAWLADVAGELLVLAAIGWGLLWLLEQRQRERQG